MLTQNGSLFFRLLLNKFALQSQEALLKILPEAEEQQVRKHTSTSQNPLTVLSRATDLLCQVHYSWLESAIKDLPEALQKSVILALTKDQQSGLEKRKLAESLPKENTPYAQSVRTFLLSKLFEVWKEKTIEEREVHCRELLLENPLSLLLSQSKRDLVQIIDLLAMHDLSEEVRHIVDKKLLRAILLNLTSSQQKYLKACLHQKAKMATLPLNVKDVYKDRKTFITLLHKRGLKRFALGLCGCEKDFVWHITHTFDIGRGKILIDAIQNEEVPKTTQMVRLEILAIVQMLKKEAA